MADEHTLSLIDYLKADAKRTGGYAYTMDGIIYLIEQYEAQLKTCEISVVDRTKILQPTLRNMLNEHAQMLQQRHTKTEEDFLISKAINFITPYMAPKPVLVSLEKCATALYELTNKDEGYLPRMVGLFETQMDCVELAKAVLDAAGVVYVD